MIDLPDFTHAIIPLFFGGFALAFGLAFLFGGGPERWGAATLLAMMASQLILYSTVTDDVYSSLDWVALTVDLVGLIGFTLIILRAYREYWTTIAWGFALISVLSHFARVNTDMIGFSYAQFKSAPTGIIIILVLIGTAAHQYRLRKNGSDRDWIPREYGDFRKLPEKLDEI